MNVIGHPYVAARVLERLNPQLVLGSYLPDIVPFVSDAVFSFEEIHQGGQQFLEYLQKEASEHADLARGMIVHAQADKYSKDIENVFAEHRDEISRAIVDSSSVSRKIAWESRFHNYLWWGVDLQILWTRRSFVLGLSDEITDVDDLLIDDTARLLSGCFNKSAQAVVDNISALIEPLEPQRLMTADGLAVMWRDIAAGLPEQDDVDPARTAELFKKCAFIVGSQWEQVVEDVVSTLRAKLL